MRLIDNNRIVLTQKPIMTQLSEQNTVRHELYNRLRCPLLIKANLKTDRIT